MPEFWNKTEKRGHETVTFWRRFLPLMKVGGTTPDQHATDLARLQTLAQEREDRLADARAAKKRELAQFNLIRTLNLAVPKLIAGRFDESHPIAPLLAGVYAVVPRSDELNLRRARLLVPVWKRVNAALSARRPGETMVRDEIGVAEFEQMIAGYPALVQTTSDEGLKVAQARAALRLHHRKTDRLNKRAYKKFRAESRTHAAMRESLQTANHAGEMIASQEKKLPPYRR